MIIGINGYINSGKDTAGSIIQYLTTSKKDISYTGTYNSFIMDMNMGFKPEWEIKKFAGKLKQIASLLTGIPVEKFESQEFKQSYLGEEWNYFAAVNKEADKYYGKTGITEYSNPCSTYEEALKKVEYQRLSNKNYDAEEFKYTVRKFLQIFGTEAMRTWVHPNVWVNALMADYIPEPISFAKDKNGVRFGLENWSKWIITDVRFPNEAQAIKDKGGIVIRVHRNIYPSDPITSTFHSSENSLDNWNFDYQIHNNSDINNLISEVKAMLQKFNILS